MPTHTTTAEEELAQQEAEREEARLTESFRAAQERIDAREARGFLERLSDSMSQQPSPARGRHGVGASPILDAAVGLASALPDIGSERVVPGAIAEDLPKALIDTAVDFMQPAQDAITSNQATLELYMSLFQEKPFEMPEFRQFSEMDKLSVAKELKDVLPEIEQPHSTVGKFLRDGVAFVTAMQATRGKLKAGFAAKGLSPATSRVLADMGSGFAADFVLAKQDIANLQAGLDAFTAENPELKRITDDVTNPEKPWGGVSSRFKAALLGAGLGLAADGMLEGVKFLRKANRARIIRQMDPQARKAFHLGSTKLNGFDDPVLSEPIGLSRSPVIDRDLVSLSDEAFETRKVQISREVDALEKRMDDAVVGEDGKGLADTDPEFRRSLIDAQDRFEAFENEDFRRKLMNEDAEGIVFQLNQLGTMNDDASKVKGLILAEVVKKRGMEDQVGTALSEFAERSPDHAEIMSGTLKKLRTINTEQMAAVAKEVPSLSASRLARPSKEKVTVESLKRAEKTVQSLFGTTTDVNPAQIKAMAENMAQGADIDWESVFTKMNTNSKEAVKELTEDLTRVFDPSIQIARRHERSIDMTQQAARSTLGVADVLGRKAGEGITPELAVVSIQLQEHASREVYRLAQLAADGNSLDRFRFSKMLTTYHAITEQFFGIRAEAGRTLNVYANLGKLETTQATNISNAINAAGGDESIEKLASKILSFQNDPDGAARMFTATDPSLFTKGIRFWQESYVMGKLWMPSTHIVNSFSPALVALSQASESMAAATGERMFSAGKRDVALTEGVARMVGLLAGYRSVFTSARQGYRNQRGRGVVDAIQETRQTLEIPKTGKFTESFADPPTGMHRLGQAYQRLTRTPGVALGLEDDIAKIASYQAEVYARAARKAELDGGTMKNRMETFREAIRNPPEDIRIASVENSQYATFTDEAGIFIQGTNKTRRWAVDHGIPAFVVVPFIHTPAKIFSYNFERTPFALGMKRYKDAVASGGAEEKIAYAKIATGMGFFAMGLELAQSGRSVGSMNTPEEGRLTGALNIGRGQRNTELTLGVRRNAIFVGNDTWVDYSRLDPIVSFMLSSAGNVNELINMKEMDDEDMDELTEMMISVGSALGLAAKDRSYMQGISEVADLLSYAGEDSFKTRFDEYAARQAAGQLPFSSGFDWAGQVASQMTFGEESLPDINSVSDAFQAKFEAFAGRLPRKRTLLGETINRERFYGALRDGSIPTRKSTENQQPYAVEMRRLKMDAQKIRKRGTFGFKGDPFAPHMNFRHYPRVYELYQVLAGNQGKYMQGQTIRNYLNDLTSGVGRFSRTYEGLPTQDKKDMIRKIIGVGRDAARDEILNSPKYDHDPDVVEFRIEHEARRQKVAEERLQ